CGGGTSVREYRRIPGKPAAQNPPGLSWPVLLLRFHERGGRLLRHDRGRLQISAPSDSPGAQNTLTEGGIPVNAENLHDAIGELPMEMLKEVDAYRGRKIIPWQRYIS